MTNTENLTAAQLDVYNEGQTDARHFKSMGYDRDVALFELGKRTATDTDKYRTLYFRGVIAEWPSAY